VVAEKILHDFGTHQSGLNPSSKTLENAKSKVSRVKAFLLFMCQGSTRLCDWLFLDNHPSILRFFGLLLAQRVTAVTTVQIYMSNIRLFVSYLRELRPKHCRLSDRQLAGIQCYLKMCDRSNRRGVTVHRMQTQRLKRERLPSRADLRTFKVVAKRRIPELLGEMHTQLNRGALRQSTKFTFYGYIAGYWACCHGHRTGVYTNMRDSEVVEARDHHLREGEKAGASQGRGYIIRVSA